MVVASLHTKGSAAGTCIICAEGCQLQSDPPAAPPSLASTSESKGDRVPDLAPTAQDKRGGGSRGGSTRCAHAPEEGLSIGVARTRVHSAKETRGAQIEEAGSITHSHTLPHTHTHTHTHVN